MKRKIISMMLAVSMMLAMLTACQPEEVVDDVPDDGQQQEEIQDEQGSDEVVPETLDIVVDGVSEYVIVRGANAYIAEITASTELQSYLKKITGVEIPIVTDDSAPVAREIIVGKTNREADGQFDRGELGDDGFVIRSEGSKLWLVGGEKRGTLYSVYTFLEEYLGVRYYAENYEYVPSMTTVSFDEIEENKQIPLFIMRSTDYRCVWPYPIYAAKLKYTPGMIVGFDDATYGGEPNIWLTYSVHTMNLLMGIDDRSKEPNPCMTDENVYQTVLSNVRANLAASPDLKYISVSIPDNDKYCKCDNCKAKTAEYGNYSGVLIEFVNRIANEIKDEYPNVMVHTLAYKYVFEAPENITVADNVLVEVCSYEACFSHPLGECDKTSIYNFETTLSKWTEIAKNVAVWGYVTIFDEITPTLANFNVLRENIQLYADYGVTHVFEEGYPDAKSLEFGELRSYLLAKLMWNPYMSEDEYKAHMVDFCKGYYGAGWENIVKYIEMSDELSDPYHFDHYSDPNDVFGFRKIEVSDGTGYPEELTEDMVRNYEAVDWSVYFDWYVKLDDSTSAIFTEGKKLFAEALELAETEEQKEHVRRSAFQVEAIEANYKNCYFDAAYTSISKMLQNYFNANEDKFSSTEGASLRMKIINYATGDLRSAYRQQMDELEVLAVELAG